MAKRMQKKSYKGKSRRSDQAQPGRFTTNRLLVRRTAGSERKEMVTYVSGAIPGIGAILLLNSLGQGTDINQRIGRVIKAIGLQYKFLAIGPTASGQGDFLRVSLVWDNQSNNGASPLYTDIFDSSAGGNQITWFKNTRQYADRFTIFKDMTIPVQNQIASAESAAMPPTYQQGYIDLSSCKETQWLSTSSGMPSTGSLLIAISTFLGGGSSATSASLVGNFKFTFQDD